MREEKGTREKERRKFIFKNYLYDSFGRHSLIIILPLELFSLSLSPLGNEMLEQQQQQN